MRGCAETVQNCWNIEVKGSKMFKFHKKLKYYCQGLLEWKKNENSNSKIQIESIKRMMESLQEIGGQRDWDTWYNLRVQLEEAYKAKKEYWARKARTQFLQRG